MLSGFMSELSDELCTGVKGPTLDVFLDEAEMRMPVPFRAAARPSLLRGAKINIKGRKSNGQYFCRA